MIALVVGTILAIAAMAFVLAPLFRDANATLAVARPADARGELRSRGEAAVEALREIEFDRATGKLSDADYEMLKSRYTRQAVAAMRSESGAALVDESEIEAAVRGSEQ